MNSISRISSLIESFSEFSIIQNKILIKKILINPNININECDFFGETALIKAINIENIDIIELLLNHNADPNIPDCIGRTALHYAIVCKNVNNSIKMI